jgi:diacylglycerol kinase (ATP)
MSVPQSSRHSGYVVVANAGAGSTAEQAVAAAVARLATDAPTTLSWTQEPEECVELVRGLQDDRQLVVAGGDGSIHLALSVVAHLDRIDEPVGIIPLGTGNDFARNHGIPLDPVEAADVVIAGNAVGVDAMSLTGERRSDEHDDGRPQFVANNIHVGLGVRAARRASRWKPYARRLSYPLATAFEGVSGDPLALTVEADGSTVHDGPLLAALVLLGPSMGGGVEVTPRQPEQLDLVLVEPADTGERIDLVRAALRSRIFDAERAERHQVAEVTISGRDGVDVNVDGEMVGYRSPVTVRHRPGAWKVLLPAG